MSTARTGKTWTGIWADFRAAFAYWLVLLAVRIHPGLLAEMVGMTRELLDNRGKRP